MSDYGHWDISLVGNFDPIDYYGFVYLVTNNSSGRMYVGKKSMWSTITKKVWKADRSGKKNRKVTVESDWRSYTTSSKHINNDILAGHTFTFQILTLHTSKGTLAYNEVDHMVRRDVLRAKFDNGVRVYYNGCIPGIKFIPTEESYKKISAKLKGKSFPHLKRPCKEETKKKLSITHTGMTHTEETKLLLSELKSGVATRPHTEETKKKISESSIGKHPVTEAHRAAAARRKGQPVSEKQRLASEKRRGTKQTEEHKAKNRPSYVKVECPHCHIMVDRGNFAKAHGDKCKMKLKDMK